MKKKVILAAMAAALVLGLTACGGTAATVPELDTGKTMELKDVEKTGLAGMCEYLEGNGTIAGEYVEMKADIIGAKDGRKYAFQFEGGTVLVELYEFDPDNLDETGKETVNHIRENGTFIVMEQEVPAKISENGKYIMTNSDTSTDERHANETQKLERLFEEYAAKDTAAKAAKAK